MSDKSDLTFTKDIDGHTFELRKVENKNKIELICNKEYVCGWIGMIPDSESLDRIIKNHVRKLKERKDFASKLKENGWS